MRERSNRRHASPCPGPAACLAAPLAASGAAQAYEIIETNHYGTDDNYIPNNWGSFRVRCGDGLVFTVSYDMDENLRRVYRLLDVLAVADNREIQIESTCRNHGG